MTAEDLRYILSMSFPLVFIAFSAGALFLYLERDRVPEDFRLAMRVSVVSWRTDEEDVKRTIAAVAKALSDANA